MADRITRKVLEQRLQFVNDRIGAVDGDDNFLRLDICGMGGCDYKIESHNGSTNVSPRLTARECYNYINGILAGVALYEAKADIY